MNSNPYNIEEVRTKLNDLFGLVSNLDNGIGASCLSERTDEMSERRRVIISWNDDKSPVYRQLRAATTDEMNDRIVKAYIDSGRIWEFMDRPFPAASGPSDVTLKEYSAAWLNRKRKLKQTTRINYKKFLDEYINPTLGHKRISEITVDDVQAMLDKYKHLSRKTLHDARMILHQILRYAISDGIITRNPCESADIDIPSDKVTEREALPLEQFKDILANMPKLAPQDRRYLALIMYTGMRRGEALGLRWEDIDMDAKYLSIRRNVIHPQQNTPIITTPKTKAGRRSIPMDEYLIEALKPFGTEGYVVGGESPLTLSAFRAMNVRINAAIDMHGATAHTLRHSYLTYAVGETTDFKTVQGISGHADLSVLLNKYAHIQKDKVEALSRSMHERLAL